MIICPICQKPINKEKDSISCPAEYDFKECHLTCWAGEKETK